MSEQRNFWKVFPVKQNKKQLWVILLVGILLLVIALPTQTTKESEQEETSLEKRLESILGKMQGVGDVKVMITESEENCIEGVAVVAQGADNSVVVRNITETVQALFPVDSHKIKVIKGNQIN